MQKKKVSSMENLSDTLKALLITLGIVVAYIIFTEILGLATSSGFLESCTVSLIFFGIIGTVYGIVLKVLDDFY